MARFIRLGFPSEAVWVDVELDEVLAPQTCAALWDSLPQSGTAHHAVYSGSEGVVILPKLVRVAPENATHVVRKGDVAYTWFAAGSAFGVTDDFSEICWFYDDDACPSMHGGPVPVSVFGRMVGDVDAFCAVSRRLRRIGVRGLVVERVDSAARRHDSVVHRPLHGSSFDPIGAVGADGAVAVVFHSSPGSPEQGLRTVASLSISTDSGSTWSEPEFVSGGEIPGLRCVSVWAEPSGFVVSAIAPGGEAVGWLFDGAWHPVDVDSSRTKDRVPSASSERPGGLELSLGGAVLRPVHATGPGAVSVHLPDGSELFVLTLWDNAPGADVPGVCGIHASRVGGKEPIHAD